MGWSEITARPVIDKLFKSKNIKYTVQRVEAPTPQVQILYAGNAMPLRFIRTILSEFPEHVYVNFVPNTPFNDNDAGDSFLVDDTGAEEVSR